MSDNTNGGAVVIAATVNVTSVLTMYTFTGISITASHSLQLNAGYYTGRTPPQLSGTFLTTAWQFYVDTPGTQLNGELMLMNGLAVGGETDLSTLVVANTASVGGVATLASDLNVSGNLAVTGTMTCGYYNTAAHMYASPTTHTYSASTNAPLIWNSISVQGPGGITHSDETASWQLAQAGVYMYSMQLYNVTAASAQHTFVIESSSDNSTWTTRYGLILPTKTYTSNDTFTWNVCMATTANQYVHIVFDNGYAGGSWSFSTDQKFTWLFIQRVG